MADGLARDAGWLVAILMPQFVSGEKDNVFSHLVIGQIDASFPPYRSACEMLCHGEARDAGRLSAFAFALALAFAFAFAEGLSRSGTEAARGRRAVGKGA